MDTTTTTIDRAVWSTSMINDFPDSSFAYVEDGGKKDEENKTTPRTLRHLPYKDADGKVDAAHVRNALARLSQTQIPDDAKKAARSKLAAAAKSVGVEVSDEEDRTVDAPLTRAVKVNSDGSHEPTTETHSHQHPAFGSQGDDSTHSHEHSHSGDADHQHEHSEDRADMPTHAFLYAPITRIDPDKREVEGVATSEALDSFKTIFSYEASKKAFQKWIERTSNVREMHDRKAVGKGIGVYFDDANKQVIVRSRVSRSADGENSWIKLQEGILNGYSVGATNPVWDTVERDGKKYPYLVSYDLSELSYVDNASNPDAQGLVLCRADGLTSLIDITQDDATTQTATTGIVAVPPVERAGARVSSTTRDAMHDSIKHTLHAAASQMKNCGCENCTQALSMIDPDDDGDIDMGSYDDPDDDAAQLYANNDGDMDRAVTAAIERVLPGLVERVLSPVYQRQQQFLARMVQTPEPEIISPFDTSTLSALEERLTAAIERVAASSSQSEVRAELSAVRETVERIAAQPMPGGPVLNGARPVDKHLANQPYNANALTPELRRAHWDDLQRRGLLNTPELQMAAAADNIQLMPGRR